MIRDTFRQPDTAKPAPWVTASTPTNGTSSARVTIRRIPRALRSWPQSQKGAALPGAADRQLVDAMIDGSLSGGGLSLSEPALHLVNTAAELREMRSRLVSKDAQRRPSKRSEFKLPPFLHFNTTSPTSQSVTGAHGRKLRFLPSKTEPS